MPTFWNLSNHGLRTAWTPDQKASAEIWGGVARTLQEIPFPAVDPEAGPEAVAHLADQVLDALRQAGARPGDPLMVMGEFTLTHALVLRLKAAGMVPLASTTRREAVERLQEDGTLTIQHTFRFVGFRAY